MNLTPDAFGNAPFLTDMVCPISGQPLWELPEHFEVLDGPTRYTTEDDKYMYEEWPRCWDKLYLVRENGNDPVMPNEFVKNKFFVLQDDGTWKGYYTTYQHGSDIPDYHPFLYQYAKTVYVQYVIERRLNEIRWEKNKSDSIFDTIALPIARQVNMIELGRELVSVQPLSMPTGQIFYLDYKYKKKKLPKWLWDVKDETKLAHDGGPLAQRGTTTRKYKVFGVTIWRTKTKFMS